MGGAAAAPGISNITLHRTVNRRIVWAHTMAVKPTLSQENESSRLQFCAEHIGVDWSTSVDVMEFVLVHVDKKWFYFTKNTRQYRFKRTKKNNTRPQRAEDFVQWP